jgi:hypothetical protein
MREGGVHARIVNGAHGIPSPESHFGMQKIERRLAAASVALALR